MKKAVRIRVYRRTPDVKVMTINRAKIEKKAGVKLPDDDTAWHMVHLVENYFEYRNRDSDEKRRLRRLLRLKRQGHLLGSESVDLKMFEDRRHPELSDRRWPLQLLSEVIEEIDRICREDGTEKEGTDYNKVDKKHDGFLIDLFRELCRQIGKLESCPSAHTIHRAREMATKRRKTTKGDPANEQ
jgi:hypothetical protein